MDHATILLKTLQWLPTVPRIKSTYFNIAYKILCYLVPKVGGGGAEVGGSGWGKMETVLEQ